MIDNIASLFFKDYIYNRPGFAFAIISEGKIILEHYQGLANMDYDVPITSKTTFRIASLSKQFIGMSIRLLEEECIISLDDSVREYIPELPEYANEITIYHLLYHTSGLREFSYLLWGLAGTPRGDRITEEELLELIIKQESFSYKPGTKFRYNNTGYFLLGLVIERATSMKLSEYVSQNIFKRLNMNNTHFHDDWSKIVKFRATGYSVENEEDCHIYDMMCTGLVGDEGIFTNINDWFLWDQNFYRNRLTKRRQILTRKMLEPGHLDTGEEVPYASGLHFKRNRGYNAYYHEGEFLGFKSYQVLYPELQFSVICMANYEQFDPADIVTKAERMILEDYLGEEPSKKKEEISEEDEPSIVCHDETWSEEEIQDYLGEYHSDELETTYIVNLEENKLVLKNRNIHRRSTKEPLKHLEGDRFCALFWKWEREIEFVRDEKNEILKFVIIDKEEEIQQHEFLKISCETFC